MSPVSLAAENPADGKGNQQSGEDELCNSVAPFTRAERQEPLASLASAWRGADEARFVKNGQNWVAPRRIRPLLTGTNAFLSSF